MSGGALSTLALSLSTLCVCVCVTERERERERESKRVNMQNGAGEKSVRESGKEKLVIPIRGFASEERNVSSAATVGVQDGHAVTVSLKELPDDPDPIVDVLYAEVAPLELWLDIAHAYREGGRDQAALKVLEEGSGDDIEDQFKTSVHERALILFNYATMHMDMGTGAASSSSGAPPSSDINMGDRASREQARAKARALIERAKTLDPSGELGNTVEGCVNLQMGELNMAKDRFSTALEKIQKRTTREERGGGSAHSARGRNLLGRSVLPAIGKAVALMRLGNNEHDKPDHVSRDIARNNFKSALKLFGHALRSYSDPPLCVQLGFGHCLAKLGRTSQAKKAFERVLELDPENRCALVALSVLDAGDITTADEASLRKSIQRILAVTSWTHGCEYLAILVQRYCTFQGNSELGKEIADELSKYVTKLPSHQKLNSAMNMLAKFEEGRAMHLGGDDKLTATVATKIIQKYMQAAGSTSQRHSTFPVAVVGSALMHARISDFGQAAREMKKLLRSEFGGSISSSVETLEHPLVHWLAGSIFVKSGDTVNATKNLKAAADFFTHEPGIQRDLGLALQKKYPAAALEAYEKALQLAESRKETKKKTTSDVSVPLLNNTAVLIMQLEAENTERLEYATTLLERAPRLMTASTDDGKKPVTYYYSEAEKAYLAAVIDFNKALLLEKLGKTADAEAAYVTLLGIDPSFTDASIRLAQLRCERGEMDDAMQILESALEMCADEEKGKVHCAIGTLHLRRTDHTKPQRMLDAQEAFEKAIKLKFNTHKTYAQVALANIYLDSAPVKEREGKREDPEKVNKRRKNLGRAYDLYKEVLEKNPRNMWAANGIGCILAMKSDGMKDASKIFSMVQELALADGIHMPYAEINLAHTYLDEGSYVPAAKLYNNVNTKFYSGENVGLLLSIGRTLYDNHEFAECKTVLSRAAELEPNNEQVKFDVAVVMQKLGDSGFTEARKMKDRDARKYPMVKSSIDHMKESLQLFSAIQSSGSESSYQKLAGDHVGYLSKLVERFEGYVVHLKKEYDIAMVEEEARKLRAQAHENRKREELKKKEEREAEAREEQRRIEAELKKEREAMNLSSWKLQRKEEADDAAAAEAGQNEKYGDLVGEEDAGGNVLTDTNGGEQHGDEGPDVEMDDDVAVADDAPNGEQRRRKRAVVEDDDADADAGNNEADGDASVPKRPRNAPLNEEERKSLARDIGLDSDSDDDE